MRDGWLRGVAAHLFFLCGDSLLFGFIYKIIPLFGAERPSPLPEAGDLGGGSAHTKIRCSFSDPLRYARPPNFGGQ